MRFLFSTLLLACFGFGHAQSYSRILAKADSTTLSVVDSTFEAGFSYFFKSGFSLCGPSIRLSMQSELLSILSYLRLHEEFGIQIISNTDYRGSLEYNRKLTSRRAESLKEFLMEKGLDSSRVEAIGAGESDPLVIDSLFEENYEFELGQKLDEAYVKTLSPWRQEVAHQLNDRIEVRLVSKH